MRFYIIRDGFSDLRYHNTTRESTSGLTIRQLPLTIGSSLGVLDNPHYQMSILGKERKYCGIFWCTFGEKRAIIVRPAIMTSQHDW